MPISSQSNIKVENIWDLLGSFYTNLDPDDKTNVEALWEGLVGGGDALFFNMAQSYLSQYLDISQGYLNLGFENYEFKFNGPNNNVGAINYYLSPVSVSGYASTPTVSGTTYQYLVTA